MPFGLGYGVALTVAYVAVEVQAILNFTELVSGIIKYQKQTQLRAGKSPAQACILSPVSWWYDCYVIGQTGG
jgi:hypothetical protein